MAAPEAHATHIQSHPLKIVILQTGIHVQEALYNFMIGPAKGQADQHHARNQ